MNLSDEFHPCPKPRVKALDKRDAARDVAAEDRRQRAICKQRSGGVCEVWVSERLPGGWRHSRCRHRATENHHLLGGIGIRNAGRSLLAAHRLEVCRECHEDITRHVLVPVGESREYAASVAYERIR